MVFEFLRGSDERSVSFFFWWGLPVTLLVSFILTPFMHEIMRSIFRFVFLFISVKVFYHSIEHTL